MRLRDRLALVISLDRMNDRERLAFIRTVEQMARNTDVIAQSGMRGVTGFAVAIGQISPIMEA